MAKDALQLGADDTGRVESISEFTRRVKVLLEEGIRPCWVRGEVSNLRNQASGHVYFSLKDAGAQLACVLFRGDAARQSLVLRDGRQVLAYGEISVYEQRGQYQLIVRAVVEDGVNEQAVLVPQQGVSRDPKGNPIALVVNAAGKVEARAIVLDRAIGDKWLVTKGLIPGDRLIVEGIEKVRPGNSVRAVDFVAPAATGAKSGAGQSQVQAR